MSKAFAARVQRNGRYVSEHVSKLPQKVSPLSLDVKVISFRCW